MEIRIRDTGQVVNEREFRSLHPRTSFPSILTPAILADFGADPVLESPTPVAGDVQIAARVGAVQDALGNWVQAWELRPMFSDYTDADGVLHTRAAQEAAYRAGKLAQAKAAKITAIEAHRDRLLDTGGYKIDVPGKGPRWFASDPRSQRRQLALQMMGAGIPPGVQWRTLDNDKVTITQQIANLIFQAAAAQDIAIDTAAELHKAAVLASADPAIYDFSTGWPLTFKV